MSDMNVFMNNISSYPTAIFTGMMMFVVLYWLVSLFGMADLDAFEIDTGDISDVDLGIFTGLLLKFGLHGVPLLVILTSISIIGWVLSYFYTSLLNQYFPSGILHYVFGTGAGIVVLLIAMAITGVLISPLRKKIAERPKRNAQSFIGRVAVVRSFEVNDTHGEVSLADGGAGLILKVRATEGTFKKGDKVILSEHVAERNIYKVVIHHE